MSDGISLAPPSGFIPAVTAFAGTLGSLGKVSRTSKRTQNSYEVVCLDFGDIEVLESTSPVDESQPLTIDIFYSEDRENTVWDEFRKSLVVFMPDEAGGDINWFIGQRFTMGYDKVMISQRDDATGKWGVSEGRGWVVRDIEGLTNTAVATDGTINQYIAKNIADGNTESEALQKFYADETVRSMPGYQDAVNAATDGNLFPNLIAENLIVEAPDGKFVLNA